MILDIAQCIGCYACQIACKDEHTENDWSPYAKPQPDTGHFWMLVKDMERGTTPKVKVTYTPMLCNHCDNPPCLRVCESYAITKRNDGIVLIDPVKCIGCKLCIDACPYSKIYFNEQLKIAQKCTLCAQIIDGKDHLVSEPRCASVCQRGVLSFGDEDDPRIKELLRKAEVLHPEYGTRPRVYYLNLPRPFIAGTLIDPSLEEVVQGAKVTTTDTVTGAKHEVASDEFGDFWIMGLEWDQRYLVKVEKDGYSTRTIGVIHTDKDVNLGDTYMCRIASPS